MHFAHPLLLLSLLGCGSPTSSQGSASGSAAAGSSTTSRSLCEKAEQLQKRLSNIDAKATRVSIGPEVMLPESKEGSPVSSMAAVVVIGAKDIRVNGTRVTRPSAVKEQVQTSGTVLLALPKGAEGIDRLADVVAAIGREHQIYLLATPPETKLEAPPKGLDVGAADPSERATSLAQALRKSIATCPDAKKVFERLSSAESDGKGETVKRDLPAAVDACGCNVPDDLEDLMAYLLGGDQPVIGKKLNVESDNKAAKTLSLKGLDGQKLYDALPADGAAVKLEM